MYAIKWSVICTVTIKVVPFSNSSKNACTSFQWIRIECKVYRWRFNERINRWNTDKSGTFRAAILGWKMAPWLALANKHIGSMFEIRGQNSTSAERFLNSSRTFPRRRRGGRKKESKENKSFKEILSIKIIQSRVENFEITLNRLKFKEKEKKKFATIFERRAATRINIPKHERSRDNTPENSWSNYTPPLPRSHRWISFQFSSTRYSSYAALETKTYYLPGEIRPFPDHVNYGNCRLLTRANSPKSALSTGFATRVISSETLFECGCLPSSRIVTPCFNLFRSRLLLRGDK